MKKPGKKRSRQATRDVTRFRKNLGLALRKIRVREKLTQKQVGEKVGLSGSSAIANIENGSNAPTLVSLFKMSKVFKFSIDTLLEATVK